MSLPDLIFSIPGYVDNCIKTYRAIQVYRGLDESFRNLMERSIRDSEALRHTMRNLKKISEYSEASQSHFRSLLQQAKNSMENINAIVDDWKERLQITDSDDAAPSKAKRSKILFRSFLSRGLTNARNVLCIRLAAHPRMFASRSKKVGEEVKNGEKQVGKTSNIRARTVYLIEGKSKIIEALEDLERILQQIDSALLASNSVSAESDDDLKPSAMLEFVHRAETRDKEKVEVKKIDIEALEPLIDIDSEMPTGIYRVQTGRYEGCIVDPRNVRYYTAKGHEKIAWNETNTIARLFAEEPNNSHILSSVGILPSCGVTDMELHLHGIVFRLPHELGRTRTLRNMLVEGNSSHPLHERVQLAIRLATSILVVHSLKLVHKNVKPDSILVAESPVGKPEDLYPNKIGIPFLLAFDASRTSDGPSMQGSFAVPEGGLWEILYTHPRHLVGYERQYKYEMQDDIFGLGICLLEVALWKSLFRWSPKSYGGYSFQLNTDVADVSILGCRKVLEARGMPMDTSHIMLRKEILTEAAKKMIPPVMGNTFRDVVVDCLTFGDLEKSSELSASGRKSKQSEEFVRSILTKLYSIKL